MATVFAAALPPVGTAAAHSLMRGPEGAGRACEFPALKMRDGAVRSVPFPERAVSSAA
ncbi:exported hypothetical protein [Agrobacterium deltaense NCPPB 1641]|uniref:Uncharacterized protein n=1 Tax=Agrobacterium deltaense NCPPB 1641 TaxID=1183425 RepID=A0A1S7TNB4_9HYPH|nr:exported hypothetical protein [Agrobacterium deltaense NCPPB 1641]